ncbi:MAG: dockerin type I repeat-containing protein, partial [Oscillospiraceae bacterium]|nr:dockerin type I repeat-containing protein [Oscillospiraceae bacterium]
DGKVNNKDVTRLQRYLKGAAVEVNEAALDVNGDGKVNNKDLTRLQRCVKGADVELH